jgi:ribosomal protein S18 acetylase RimI-like enzyme
MKTTLDIRQLKEDDLKSLLDSYHDLHPNDDPLPPRNELELLWEKVCKDPGIIYLGAFNRDEMISTCTAAIIPNFTRGARPYAVIENVWTHPAYRGQGIGSAVLQKLLSMCREANCYKVMLMSASHRDAAHEFYKHNGFDSTAKRAFIIRK